MQIYVNNGWAYIVWAKQVGRVLNRRTADKLMPSYMFIRQDFLVSGLQALFIHIEFFPAGSFIYERMWEKFLPSDLNVRPLTLKFIEHSIK